MPHFWALLTLGFVISNANAAFAEPRRFALVIGNDQYTEVNQLNRAVNDATAVAKILEEQGFKVKPEFNVDGSKMDGLVKKFLADIRPSDVVAFYFAGHGVLHDNTNYLIPTDMPKLGDTPGEELEASAFRFSGANSLLSRFEEKRRKFKENNEDVFGIFILDACRDFPVAASKDARFIDFTLAGLNPITPPGGSFVMYSADAHQQAMESLGENDPEKTYSLYTRELKKLLGNRNLDLVQMAKELKWRVYDLALTASRPKPQTPAFYDGLIHPRNIRGDPLPVSTPLPTEADSSRPQLTNIDNAKERELVGSTVTRSLAPAADGKSTEATSKFTVNSIVDCVGCPELLIIQGEHFKIGSPANQLGHPAQEKEADIALEHAYAIGKHEVTWGQWQACVRSEFPEKCDILDTGYADEKPGAEDGSAVERRELPDDRRPVMLVTWEQAQDYVRYLSAVTSKKYRLPTEAEWEFAARGGNSLPYSFSLEDNSKTLLADLCQHANGADQSLRMWLWSGNTDCNDKFDRGPAPVGSFRPNAFGLYDVHGNVWEWVNDCWREHRASDGKPSPDDSPEKGCRRTVRGGSWQSEPDALRSASRTSFSQTHARRTVGFRVLREVVQVSGQPQ